MKEQESLESRIQRCRIHQWAAMGNGVDGYLRISDVPHELWQVFHELVVERGKMPVHLTVGGEIIFKSTKTIIYDIYQIHSNDQGRLNALLDQLINQWMLYMDTMN